MSFYKRLQQALTILLQPELFKICEGCSSIVATRTVICPNCKAYRFDTDEDNVIEQTRKLSTSEQQSVTRDDLF